MVMAAVAARHCGRSPLLGEPARGSSGSGGSGPRGEGWKAPAP